MQDCSIQYIIGIWFFPICLHKFDSTSSELWRHLVMIPKLIFFTYKHISDLYWSYEVKVKKSKKSIFWPIFYLYLTEGWGRNFDQIWLSSLPWSEGLAWQCLGSSIFQPWPQWVTGSFGTINGGAQQVTGYLKVLS